MTEPTSRPRAADVPPEVQAIAARRILAAIEREERLRATTRRRVTGRQLAAWTTAAVLTAVVLALGALFATDAIGQDTPTAGQPSAREQALAHQLKTEREKARTAVRLARATGYAQGRRSIILRTNTEHIVRAVAIAYGHDPDRAVTRAKCESGHAMSPTAGNGQYIGVFQIGTKGRGSMWARAAGDFTRAGIGPTDALANVLVAMRYADEHGWGEWECGGWSHR